MGSIFLNPASQVLVGLLLQALRSILLGQADHFQRIIFFRLAKLVQALKLFFSEIIKTIHSSRFFNLIIISQHPVKHAAHVVSKLNIQLLDLFIDMRQPLFKLGKSPAQFFSRRNAFTQVSFKTPRKFFFLINR